MRMAENCIVVRVNKIDGLKSGPNFPRVAQKVASAVLPYKVKSEKPKSHQAFGLLL